MLQNEVNMRRSKVLEMSYQKDGSVKASWQNHKDMLNRDAARSLGLDEAHTEAALAWGKVFESMKQDIKPYPYDFNRIRPLARELERIRTQLRPVTEAVVAEKVIRFRRKRLETRHLLRDLVTKDVIVSKGMVITKHISPPITQRFRHTLLSTPAPSIMSLLDNKHAHAPTPRMLSAMFGSSHPVRQHSSTMTFRRYPNLGTPETRENVLVNSLLKKRRTLACKFAKAKAICDDSWVVDLTQPEKRNTLMDSYFRTLRQPQQETKAVDVSQELMDLMKIYSDAHEQLSTRERYAHSSLVDAMRTYLEVYDERRAIADKLSTLKSKIIDPNRQPDEDDEDGDDE